MKDLPKNIEHRSPAKEELLRLKEQLEAIEKSKPVHQVFVGFDGFVDKIQKAVKKKSGDNSIYFSSIQEFSKHISSLAGRSGQIELVTTQTKAGGNAPILCNALGELNVKSFCVGSLGTPVVDPLFQGLASKAEVLSINAPGRSQAIEFNDGKLIFSDLSGFVNYDWNFIKKNADLEKIRDAVRSSNLVALVDWSNLANATNIWQGLLDDVIKVVNRNDLYFLFDLCDPSRKDAMEIDEMLDLVSSFSHYGKVTIALNENEATKIWMALNGYEQNARNSPPCLMDIGAFINYTVTVDTLLIHPRDRTLAFQKNNMLELDGRFVKEPKVQTGGGDNFNAGYCLGLLNNLPMEQCVLLGISNAGAYVQNGKSPALRDLISYLNVWAMEVEMPKDSHSLAGMMS